jgi:hypothetical protein
MKNLKVCYEKIGFVLSFSHLLDCCSKSGKPLKVIDASLHQVDVARAALRE